MVFLYKPLTNDGFYKVYQQDVTLPVDIASFNEFCHANVAEIELLGDNNNNQDYVFTSYTKTTPFMDGDNIFFNVSLSNQGPATININGIGALKLLDSLGNELVSDFLQPKRIYQATYDSTADGGNGAFLLKFFIDDDYRETIKAYNNIYNAISMLEAYLGYPILPKTEYLYLQLFTQSIAIKRFFVQQVLEITYEDINDTLQTMDPGDYTLFPGENDYSFLNIACPLPITNSECRNIKIAFKSYGEGAAIQGLRQTILQLACYLSDNAGCGCGDSGVMGILNEASQYKVYYMVG